MTMARTTLEAQLIALASASDPTMQLLRAGQRLGLRSWCIGAGAVRNLVWDHLHGLREATPLEDVDLVFYDAGDLSQELERQLEQKLSAAEPSVHWEVVNQAAVHRWIDHGSGQPPRPFLSLSEGIASWPEFATCVGLTLDAYGAIDVIAPHGLHDLFDMRVRWNPERVSRQVYAERIAKKRFAARWPLVQVLAAG